MRRYQVSAQFMDAPCPFANQEATVNAGSLQVAVYRAMRDFVGRRGIKGLRLKTVKVVITRIG